MFKVLIPFCYSICPFSQARPQGLAFINKVVAIMNYNAITVVMPVGGDDGLGEDSEARTIITRDRVDGMLEEFCQAYIITTMLSPSQPSYQFDI